MKINKVWALCKAAKKIVIYDTPCSEAGGQWLGDGSSMYPRGALPNLDDKALYALFDVSDDEQEKFTYCEVKGTPVSLEPVSGESEAVSGSLNLYFNGASITALTQGKETLFFQDKYAGPLSGENFTYHIRHREDGQAYIVCKSGLLTRAVFTPYNVGKADLELMSAVLLSAQKTIEKEQPPEGTDPEQTWFAV